MELCVNRVIPAVSVRQWVFSLRYALRYRVAFDAALLSEILGIMVGTVFEFLKRRARDSGIPEAKCGAVALVQRSGSAANLNPHAHILIFVGVYAALDKDPPEFYAMRPPDTKDVVAVAERVAMRVAAMLQKRDGAAAMDPDQPVMSAIYGTSIVGPATIGKNMVSGYWRRFAHAVMMGAFNRSGNQSL